MKKSSINHIFRTIWSEVLHTWVAVSELVSAKGKRSGSGALNAASVGAGHARDSFHCRGHGPLLQVKSIALVVACCFCTNVQANPIGAEVVHGTATINQAGNTLTVTNSPNAIINWQGFSINPNETTRFVQQSAASSVLNRVVGTDPSQLLGTLTSNGKIFLINPSGILVGQGARIDVAGFVASTLNLSNEDFLAGKLNFTSYLPSTSGRGAGGEGASVTNSGAITTPEGGSVYLIAPNVTNEGIITTPGGETLLAAGNTVQLIDTATPGVTVEVTGTDNAVTNLGQILADSGRIGMVGAVVKNSGAISASSLVSEGGRVFLKATKSTTTDASSRISADGAKGGQIILKTEEGGQVSGNLTGRGTLSAQGDGTQDSGGFVETSAAYVDLNEVNVNTRGGEWLIDPVDFTIAATGGDITGVQLSTNLGAGNVTILSTNGAAGTAGDVNVNDAVSWSANKLTLNAQNNININSTMNGSGTASLALEYGQQAVAAGNTSAYNIHAPVNLPAGNNFSAKLGSDGTVINYTVITSLGAEGSTTGTDLQGMNGSLAGYYALGADIDAAATSGWGGGTGFLPVGDGTTAFTGSFDGLGHVVSNLTINRPAMSYVGLFGVNGGAALQNVGLTSGSVSGLNFVGGLAGMLTAGTLSNSYASIVVTGDGGDVGGLVGYSSGSISNSSASGSVTSVTGTGVGGLAGTITGTIGNSYATGSVTGSGRVGGLAGHTTGTVSNSYATGDVSGTAAGVGGLVGWSDGPISNSYATGNVSSSAMRSGGLVGALNGANADLSNSYATGDVTSTSTVAGGLVGVLVIGGSSVSNCYAAGTVTATAFAGGLVGTNSGTISNSYWNADANAIGVANGAATGTTGLTTAQMRDSNNFSGWDFTTVWNIDSVSSLSYPYLRNNTQTSHPGSNIFSWDGEASDGLWSSALNWSNDILPPTGAAVTIGSGYGTITDDIVSLSLMSLVTDSTFTIAPNNSLTLTGSGIFNAPLTVSSGATLATSGSLVLNAASTVAGTLNLNSSTLTMGDALSLSGVLQNGTINGSSLTSSSGTLDNVIIGSSMDMAGSGILYVNNDLLLANGVNFNVDANQVRFNAAAANIGLAASATSATLTHTSGLSANNGNNNGVVTIASGVTVQGGGVLGNVSANGGWINNGVIDNSSASRLTINSTNFTNNGLVTNQSTAGSTNGGHALTLSPTNLNNTGSIINYAALWYNALDVIPANLTNSGIIKNASTDTGTSAGTGSGTGTVTVSVGTSYSNTGSLDILAGTMEFTKPVADNAGVINLSGGTLNLRGSMTTAGLGTINRTAGSVNIAGSLDNTGNTLDIGGAGIFGTGGLTSLGINTVTGTIVGGTIVSGDASPLYTYAMWSALDGVTLGDATHTSLTTTAATSGTQILNGLTLADGFILSLGAGVNWSMVGASTINSLGASTVNLGGRTLNASTATTGSLTIGSGVTLAGSGTLSSAANAAIINNGVIDMNTTGTLNISPTTFTNNGTLVVASGTVNLTPTNLTLGAGNTLDVAGGTLTINPSGNVWSNASGNTTVSAGTLNLYDAFAFTDLGTYNRTGGTFNLYGALDLQGGTFDLTSTGQLGTGGLGTFGGTISNGTITGTTLTSSNGTLDNVTIGSSMTQSGTLYIKVHPGFLWVTGAGYRSRPPQWK